MAESGPSSGPSATLGFGAGIARGLASVYGAKRQREDTEAFESGQRRRQMAGQFVDMAMRSGLVHDTADLEPYMQMWLGLDGKGGKPYKPQKGEHNPMDVLSQVFQFPGGEAAAPAGGQAAEAGVPAAPTATPTGTDPGGALAALAGTSPSAQPPATVAGPADPQTQTLGGVRMLTDQGVVQREIEKQDAITNAKFDLMEKRAKDIYRSFAEKGMDDDRALLNAMKAAGFNVDVDAPYGAGGGRGSDFSQQIARWTLEHGRPPRSDEAEQIRTEWFAANRSMGVSLESVAKLLYDKPPQLLTPEELTTARAKVTALIGEDSYTRGINTGAAQVQTDRTRMMTPEEATKLQSTYGITQGQAAALGRVPLTPPQVQAATESYLLEQDVQTAAQLFEKVWPRTDQPEARRLALATLQRDQNPDFIQLMSLLKRMPLRLAVMTQGSRPSDTDRQVFDTAFPNTAADNWSAIQVPTTYAAGKQLLTAATTMATTARDSLGIVPLTERNKAFDDSARNPVNDASPNSRRVRARKLLIALSQQEVAAGRAAYVTDDATIDQFLKDNPKFK